jgi:DNA repair protein RadC
MFQKIKQKNHRILDLPTQSRPREKLFLKGVDNLSDEELVAILLGTGTVASDALHVSNRLLRHYPLTEFPLLSPHHLIKFPGIGQSKAARILAGLELGRRIFAPAVLTNVVIRSTQDVLHHVRDIMEKRQEYLIVFYLNARYELLQKELVGKGSLNKLLITPKEIFAPAIQSPCAFLIVVHNHPSDNPQPSDEDITFTSRIQEAGEILGIPLLDHLIVTKHAYFSFRDIDEKGG